jgi:hypothetical protein
MPEACYFLLGVGKRDFDENIAFVSGFIRENAKDTGARQIKGLSMKFPAARIA